MSYAGNPFYETAKKIYEETDNHIIDMGSFYNWTGRSVQWEHAAFQIWGIVKVADGMVETKLLAELKELRSKALIKSRGE